MTDRERYLVLLSGLLRARHELRGRPLGSGTLWGSEAEKLAHGELHAAVEMVRDGTGQGQFLTDCSEAEAVVEAHGG